MSDQVFLSLGSNRGDSWAVLRSAVDQLRGILTNLQVSSVWKTAAVGPVDQEDFLNLVVTGLCDLQPLELLTRLQQIEADHGRRRRHEVPKGPRTLDIDIVLFGSKRMITPDLTIPHPCLLERLFVLLPLLELEPDCADPVTGRLLCDAQAGLDQRMERMGPL